MKDPIEELLLAFGELVGLDSKSIRDMGDTYEQRVVAHHMGEGFEIDTAEVYDNDKAAPYETAVRATAYSEDWIPVANAATKEDAEANHDLWVRIMTLTPPDELLDVSTAASAMVKDRIIGVEWRVKRRSTNV